MKLPAEMDGWSDRYDSMTCSRLKNGAFLKEGGKL